MKQKIYNLKEFAAEYQLEDIFGAYAAHFMVTTEDHSHFTDLVKERTLFAKLLLVRQGSCRLTINDNHDGNTEIRTGDLLIASSKDIASVQTVSSDFEAECILVDDFFANDTSHYKLPEEKNKSIIDIFHFIRDIVRHQHINKIEMIRSMFNVLKLIIEELPYEQCSVSHDLGHKKEIYEIFLYHLYRSFRKERQIRFYADKLNVSAAYLSRLVKEISGSTVNDHVSSLIYKEICNLLTHSDMPIGEIADSLSFSDQSALTNFFKQRSGMTPLAYRNQ